MLNIDPGEVIVIEETNLAGVYRQRRLSVFEKWKNQGKITQRQVDAAKMFNFYFETAHLGDHYTTINLEKISRSSNKNYENTKTLDAKKKINDVFEQLGEVAGNVLWDYVGLEKPITKGKIDSREIYGALKIILDQLANYYKI